MLLNKFRVFYVFKLKKLQKALIFTGGQKTTYKNIGLYGAVKDCCY